MKYFILGGARSGKSSYAETLATRLADKNNQSIIYLATAQALDAEMEERIQHHQADRPDHWQLVEEPLQLADAIEQHSSNKALILVDCLTLWLTNCLCLNDESRYQLERSKFLHTLEHCQQNLILVSNEVGQGVVPADPLSRKFVDESGRLHQAISKLVDHLYFLVAGIPQKLK